MKENSLWFSSCVQTHLRFKTLTLQVQSGLNATLIQLFLLSISSRRNGPDQTGLDRLIWQQRCFEFNWLEMSCSSKIKSHYSQCREKKQSTEDMTQSGLVVQSGPVQSGLGALSFINVTGSFQMLLVTKLTNLQFPV